MTFSTNRKNPETNELRDGGKSIGRMAWGRYGARVGVPVPAGTIEALAARNTQQIGTSRYRTKPGGTVTSELQNHCSTAELNRLTKRDRYSLSGSGFGGWCIRHA
jgi:hypothetical protein